MYEPCDTNQSDLRALLPIGCFTVVALLLVSWDSYLYDLWQHHDVIWFYMCGKAWMNGMTPYVDFADSKGPLLWLIYGLGYLLRPRDYVGVYWLSCILYTFIFYICFKCAKLFVRDTKVSMAAVLLSALFFLSGLTHIEVRAEDFCYAFMLPVFYRFLQHTVGCNQSHSFVKSSALLLGFALGGTLLIKYSCTLMLAVFIPYFCFIVPRRCSYSPWRAMGWCVIAGVLTVLPMVAVLAAQGSLGAFIREYFLVTAGTFNNMRGESITISQVFSMFLGKRVILFTIGTIAGVALYCMRVRKDWLFVIVVLLWFIGVILLNGTDRIYLNVLSLFTVLYAGVVLQPLGHWLRHSITIAGLAIATAGILFVSVERLSLFSNETLDRKIWYYYPTLLTKYESPRLLYLMCHDHGEGVPVHGLPACKYWSLQQGYTPDMVEDQINAVKEHRCDVAFVQSQDAESIKLLEDNGYYRNDFTTAGFGDESWARFLMYSSKPLHPMLSAFPTPTEVLLKKKFGANH
ncbi:MAG: hypothetical protein IKX56_06660 [Muribaculaceae bacterium]|nr:hypothetical protein [Muribaculaceae bacterium]